MFVYMECNTSDNSGTVTILQSLTEIRFINTDNNEVMLHGGKKFNLSENAMVNLVTTLGNADLIVGENS